MTIVIRWVCMGTMLAYEVTRQYPHLKVHQLPENTGSNGFNGHRIYAACSHLVNADYVLLLDEDCFYEAIMLNPFVSLFHAMDWIGLTV